MESQANENGDSSRPILITSTGLGVVIVLVLQFVGLVIWAVTEHEQHAQLKHDFDVYVTEHNKVTDSLMMQLDALDRGGTRGLALFNQRQIDQGARITVVDATIVEMMRRNQILRTRLDEMAVRLERLPK